MNNNKPFYITTTLPYANGLPHIGHTLEFIRADVFARTKRLQGHEVFFNTGIDEHGKKNLERAEELKVTPQEYVDDMAQKWQDFCKLVDMKYDYFSRTTSEKHRRAVHEFWINCEEKGYIYKAQYNAKYCVGCEMEKTDSELDDNNECPDHEGKKIEHINEENYFFRYSKLEKELLSLYKKEPSFIIPEFRRNEIKNFVAGGLRDFSISRLKKKMPWGMPVPGDNDHVMYVWFDALPNYISCLGWGEVDKSNFVKFWQEGTVVQFAGKDNLRPQAALWQAMLNIGDIKYSDKVFIEGHILSGGKKMSKTTGNTVDPFIYIEKYGIDAVRYFLIRHIHNVQDSDFTQERFHESYIADLVNGIGNLVSRVMKMAETHLENPICIKGLSDNVLSQVSLAAIADFDFNKAGDTIWLEIGKMDEYIQETEPFKIVKKDKEAALKIIKSLLIRLYYIADALTPIMPETAKIIKESIILNKKPENLFLRLDA